MVVSSETLTCLEHHPHTELHLTRTAESRGRRREERLSRRRHRLCRRTGRADRVRTKVQVCRPGHIEGLDDQLELPRIPEVERFQHAQIEVEERRLPRAVAPDDVAV